MYKRDLSVRTESEELPPLPEYPTASRIYEFVGQLEELMGRMNPSFYGPTEPHLWLMGKIPTRTGRTAERHPRGTLGRTLAINLVDLLIKLAMERENDSHMDRYLHKHLQRETPAERASGGMSPQPQCNPWKGRGGQRKHMTETPPSKVKGPLIFSIVVLGTIKVDPATRPTVLG